MAIKKLYDKVYLREDLGCYETIEFAHSLGFESRMSDLDDEVWADEIDGMEGNAIDYLNNLNIHTHDQLIDEITMEVK
jgi:hypothetical protein|tara:strand:- start:509 stop:742 length:234 start_codon:yes stop_codon:yes gene_type:complete